MYVTLHCRAFFTCLFAFPPLLLAFDFFRWLPLFAISLFFLQRLRFSCSTGTSPGTTTTRATSSSASRTWRWVRRSVSVGRSVGRSVARYLLARKQNTDHPRRRRRTLSCPFHAKAREVHVDTDMYVIYIHAPPCIGTRLGALLGAHRGLRVVALGSGS